MSPPIVGKTNRKITLVFYYFVHIEKNAIQLFCTGDIEDINQAINIYEKYNKKSHKNGQFAHQQIYGEHYLN